MILNYVQSSFIKWLKLSPPYYIFYKKRVISLILLLTLQRFGWISSPPYMRQIINNVIKFMYFTLFITVLITAVVLVVAAYVIAKLIGPRSYNPVNGEPFECGIPTHGSSWLPMHVGYYLFAILFLMFDIETVFLYPWAVVVKQFGSLALISIGFFLVVLVLGLAYAWRKGALEWK